MSDRPPPPPPPPPPPHGHTPRPPGGLPDGNYDIFIVPPHSAGGGFLYLPSLQPQRNSFLAGVACTLLAVGVWTLAMPVLKQWLATLAQSGGLGVLLLVLGVGVAAWAVGKTQGEGAGAGPGSGGGAGAQHHTNPKANAYTPPPANHAPPPQPEPPPKPSGAKPSGAASGWEKAREETRKREEERKRAEELRRKREEAAKLREDADRAAKATAEKEKWEQARAREKEARERDARERIGAERLAREKATRSTDAREREAREQTAQEKAAASPGKRYERPTARSYAGTDDANTASRACDKPPPASSASSIVSGSSATPSHSTARTTPPPSTRAPYATTDPAKIRLKAVYLTSATLPTRPLAQLVSGAGPLSDGLVLRIESAGLFVDDDARAQPQREWDVRAWALRALEDGRCGALHVLRANLRDAEQRRYTFVLDEAEAWKVVLGLQRLRKGSQVRALGMSGLKEGEVGRVLSGLGWA